MPPKKQEEENSAPFVVWNVLPVFVGAQSAVESLKKPINIKKTLQLSKIMEVLKEKGVQKYMQEGVLNEEGHLFVSQNLQQAANQYLTQLRKPADPKKDQKKDTKKDSKKQQVPQQQVEKTIEFTFDKAVNEFLIFLDFPKDGKSLRSALQSGWKVDVLVLVEQKVKQSSRLPNYELLNKERTIEDFLKEIHSTDPTHSQHSKPSSTGKAKQAQFISELRELRTLKVGDLQNTIIIEVPYLKDLQHPESDTTEFLTSLFKRLSELTLSRSRFDSWKKEQKVSAMVPPIKQKIKREVVVQQKKEEKKGGKKDPNNQPPQTEIIQEIIEKRYEDLPGNAKSDLSHFKRIDKHRSKGHNIYQTKLDNLALSVSEQTEKQVQVEKVNIAQFGATFLQQQTNAPLNKINIAALADRLPKIHKGEGGDCLHHKSNFQAALTLSPQVNLNALLKQNPGLRSLEFQYKMELFNRTMKELQPKLSYSFDDRAYVEKLDQQSLNSRINLQLQLQPKVYLSQSKVDSFRLLILARVNPPGRIFYHNHVFDWKVLPNFQFWQQHFAHQNSKDQHFWNYDWRTNGNLKVLTKKLMPTDNMIITESTYVSGDSQHKILTLQKDSILYAFKSTPNSNIFSKHSKDLSFFAFTHPSSQDHTQHQTVLNITKDEFTVVFQETPTVFWNNHAAQSKRQFGADGEVIKYMKNNTIAVLYPNGDYSHYEDGQWKHIRNNGKIESQHKTVQMKVVRRADGDKRISVRQDQTTFVEYPNGDQLVLFKDGTKFKHYNKNTIEILNQKGIIIRKMLPKTKDFNVIGSGSAFAFLGQKNILERSYDGGLYELHHPTFTWHSYIECVDHNGTLTKEPVKIVTFREGGILKVNHLGLLTFLHASDNQQSGFMHERWLQLFTNPQYHSEGVYDVDLIAGTLTTKDKESNSFRLSLQGQSDVSIAVSFNIGSSAQNSNNYGNGFHVPQQNYFLPPPQNRVLPRLFVIYSDGSGQQYLSQQQVERLKGYTRNRVSSEGQNYMQLIKQQSSLNTYYYSNSFTNNIAPDRFDLPLIISQQSKRVNLIPARFDDITFISLEEMLWSRQYANLKECTHRLEQQRRTHKEDLQRLRKKIE